MQFATLSLVLLALMGTASAAILSGFRSAPSFRNSLDYFAAAAKADKIQRVEQAWRLFLQDQFRTSPKKIEAIQENLEAMEAIQRSGGVSFEL